MILRHSFRFWPALIALFWVSLVASAAHAQQQVQFSTETGPGYGRILATWPESGAGKDVQINANISNGVLVIHFNQILKTDPKPIKDGLPGRIALARLGTDGQTLRIALRNPAEVKTSRSFNVFAIDLIAPDSDVTPPKVQSELARRQARNTEETRKRAEAEMEKAKRLARSTPALPLQVRYATSTDNTRITFDWTEPVEFRTLDREDGLDLIFDRPAAPALAELNAALPKGLANISSIVRKSKTIVSVDMRAGFEYRTSRDGAHVVLDLFEPGHTPEPEQVVDHADDHLPIVQAVARTRATRPNPVPASGLVPVKVTATGSGLQLSFEWAAPVGAAIFQRGDWVWVIFDTNARIGLGELKGVGNRHILGRKSINGPDYTGVQIRIPASTQVEARPNGDGSVWTIVLDDKLAFPLSEIELRREADGSGPGRLAANLKNAMTLLRVKDREVGDTLAVITGTGPARGIAGGRRFVEVSVLPSAQGMAFEINADDLDIALNGELLTINSHLGLNLTPSATPLGLSNSNQGASRLAAVPAISASPGFIDFAAWKKLGGEGLFEEAYSALLRRVAIEDTDPEARMILARFLIANELGAEALGVLSLAQLLDPMLVQDARFRSLRGIANLQMGRSKLARADFAAQTLNLDPSAALWRGLLAVEAEEWTEARQNFEKGRDAFYLFTPEWQARFHIAFARAAMNLNDLGTAKAQLREVYGDDLSQPTQLDAGMARAEYLHRNGETDKAVQTLDTVIAANYEPITVKAILFRTSMLQDTGGMSPLEASDILENLRYRWRGDEVELEAVRALGAFYSEAGDYRRAMEAMSLAVRRFPDSPVARRLQMDMNRTFRELFLDGGADAMDPVQAVGLFYEFQDAAPIGPDGDRMARRMADRLIAFDLLPQAASLLQYQVDNKLFGLGKAQVATNLALVYLMDKQPQKALQAIHGSRQARLPKALNQERRLLEARALVDLGRMDHAMDLIEMDRTRDADFLRADIIWGSKDWPKITRQHLRAITRHVHNENEVSDAEAHLILRATLAAALSDDKQTFEQLVQKWAKPVSKTSSAAAFQLITRSTGIQGVEFKDLARTIGDTKIMRSYLDQYRSRVARIEQTALLEPEQVAQTEG
jgi:tetratricopeptide (TPR) repeat protein